MIVLLIFGISFILLATYTIIRISIACVFWSFSTSTDAMQIFKRCFPYYIITLTSICLAFIVAFNKEPIVIYYVSSVYFLALFLWRRKIKTYKKTFAVEPNQTHLP
ncbi:hypothetical protein BWZ20_05175 [Winogradskyella sp. J14-2]|uniref:hypothetical protein n=1 Tax=Winogradskyella sp. J14-2 TaxID=1936080 RepID=UPI0009727992|nr:hypothetical protein [Winogradskyella sp. J14-2]APY07723.1 hypothetical protein BWZ20_05175 [Winogradskyella sp. J14-2]